MNELVREQHQKVFQDWTTWLGYVKQKIFLAQNYFHVHKPISCNIAWSSHQASPTGHRTDSQNGACYRINSIYPVHSPPL